MLLKQQKRRKARCGELAGGATADFVSVCCCGPYMVLDLLILTAVRLPVGICRKALRKRRLRKLKDAELLCPKCCAAAVDDESSTFTGEDLYDSGEDEFFALAAAALVASPADKAELEKELLLHFGGAGFWRSPSQREDI